MAHLEIETREGTHRVQLERDRLSIGRLSYNDVVLPFAQISRQHAELRFISGRWWIADLHSTNGVQLGDQRIQEHCLADGDRITLAPGVSFRFVENGPAASAPRQRFALPSDGQNPFGSGDATPLRRTWGPEQNTPTHPGQAPFVPPSSVSPMRPRSVFADDEVPYVPPGMAPPSPPALQGYPDVGRHGGPSSLPLAGGNGNPFMPPAPNTPAGGNAAGYPAPPGPLHAGADPHDLYMRATPAGERARSTSGPASKLLHVCQTCGQLTMPDAVYCQSCHHSIAHECSNCRLSLLPIQERCPRCHTPNEASVRRAHPGREDQ